MIHLIIVHFFALIQADLQLSNSIEASITFSSTGRLDNLWKDTFGEIKVSNNKIFNIHHPNKRKVAENEECFQEFFLYTVFKPKIYTKSNSNRIEGGNLSKNLEIKKSGNRISFKAGKLIVFSIPKNPYLPSLQNSTKNLLFKNAMDRIHFHMKRNYYFNKYKPSENKFIQKNQISINEIDAEAIITLKEDSDLDKIEENTELEYSNFFILAKDKTSSFNKDTGIKSYFSKIGNEGNRIFLRKNKVIGGLDLQIQLPSSFRHELRLLNPITDSFWQEIDYEMQEVSNWSYQSGNLIQQISDAGQIRLKEERIQNQLKEKKSISDFFLNEGLLRITRFRIKKLNLVPLSKGNLFKNFFQDSNASLLNKEMKLFFPSVLKMKVDKKSLRLSYEGYENLSKMNPEDQESFLTAVTMFKPYESEETKMIYLDLEIDAIVCCRDIIFSYLFNKPIPEEKKDYKIEFRSNKEDYNEDSFGFHWAKIFNNGLHLGWSGEDFKLSLNGFELPAPDEFRVYRKEKIGKSDRHISFEEKIGYEEKVVENSEKEEESKSDDDNEFSKMFEKDIDEGPFAPVHF